MVIMQLDNLAGVLGKNPVGMLAASLVNITIEVEWHWLSMFFINPLTSDCYYSHFGA